MKGLPPSSPGFKITVLKKVQVNLPFPLLVESLDAVLEIGLQPEIYFSSQTLDHLSLREVKRTSRALSRKGVPTTFHGPFMDLNPGAVDDKVRELTIFRFKQVLKMVPHFQPLAIVFHSGYDRWRYDDDVDLWLENSLFTWKPLAERAEGLSVQMALENVFDENPTALTRLLNAVDSPFLGYCLDAGHGHLFSQVPLVDWVEVLGSRLVEIHLHDNHQNADEHLPLGYGDIDFPGLFSRLREKNLHPIYTLEPHEIGHLEPSLQAMEKYLS